MKGTLDPRSGKDGDACATSFEAEELGDNIAGADSSKRRWAAVIRVGKLIYIRVANFLPSALLAASTLISLNPCREDILRPFIKYLV